MADIQALCMKCRAPKHDDNGQPVLTAAGKPAMSPTKKNMKDPQVAQNDKGRWSARGTCPDCGTGMFKFMSEADAKAHQAAA